MLSMFLNCFPHCYYGYNSYYYYQLLFYYHCHYCYLSHNLSLNLKLTASERTAASMPQGSSYLCLPAPGFQALEIQSQVLLLYQASRLPCQHYSSVKFCQLSTLSRVIRKLMSGQNSLNYEVKNFNYSRKRIEKTAQT